MALVHSPSERRPPIIKGLVSVTGDEDALKVMDVLEGQGTAGKKNGLGRHPTVQPTQHTTPKSNTSPVMSEMSMGKVWQHGAKSMAVSLLNGDTQDDI